jgi:DNA repair protein RadC
MPKTMRAAGEQLGIPLHDHVIIGKNSHVSFKARGLL